MGGLATLRPRILGDQFDATRDVPFKAAAKPERRRRFLVVLAGERGLEPGVLVGGAGGDVPGDLGAVDEVIPDADAGGGAMGKVLERVPVILARGQDQENRLESQRSSSVLT